jgi:hypothetical protein
MSKQKFSPVPGAQFSEDLSGGALPGAHVKIGSHNAKIGGLRQRPVIATRAAMALTCHADCAYRPDFAAGADGYVKIDRSHGKPACYAANGTEQLTVNRINNYSHGIDGATANANEAALIDAIPGGEGVIRVHVSGDFATPEGARAVGAAVSRYAARSRAAGARPLPAGRAVAWGYTHNPTITAADTGPDLSMARSVDTLAQADAALADGMIPAMGYAGIPSAKALTLTDGTGAGEAIRWIPCPQQRNPKQIDCSACGLCASASRLVPQRIGILFETHGDGAATAADALAVRRGSNQLRILNQ